MTVNELLNRGEYDCIQCRMAGSPECRLGKLRTVLVIHFNSLALTLILFIMIRFVSMVLLSTNFLFGWSGPLINSYKSVTDLWFATFSTDIPW